MTYKNVINFWFDELQPKDWWKKSDEFDAMISKRFKGLLMRAKSGELHHWRNLTLGGLLKL